MLYALAWATLVFDYDAFLYYKLPLAVSLCGLFQAVSASLTFWFLPRELDNGYFSDKGILSKLFVKENVFYQLLCVFGALYPLYKDELEDSIPGRALVALFVFFPYLILRPFFPTTRLSYTQNSKKSERYRSTTNKQFYLTGTTLIKYFYIWGKHGGHQRVTKRRVHLRISLTL